MKKDGHLHEKGGDRFRNQITLDLGGGGIFLQIGNDGYRCILVGWGRLRKMRVYALWLL